LRPSRVALATTLNPDSQMKPVFMPSAPGTDKEAVMASHSLLANLYLDRREEIGVLRKLDNDGAG
jgi:hypothetical protein